MLNLKRIYPPAGEPVSVEQVKAHLRIDNDAEDDLLTLYISAAREYVEKRLNRCLLSQTWLLSLDTFPWGGYSGLPGSRSECWFGGMAIVLPKPPTLQVESITYQDYGGTTQTVDPSTYTVDLATEPARIVPATGHSWPFLEAYQPSCIQVIFDAGYGLTAAQVPQNIILAIYLLVGHYYANREATTQGVAVTNVPLAVDALLGCSTFHTFSLGA